VELNSGNLGSRCEAVIAVLQGLMSSEVELVPGGVTGDVTGSELAEVCQQSHMSVTGCNTGHITEVVDLIVQYKDHSEWVTFHVMVIGQTMIILGHTWLMEHNPEIDWCTGEISIMRCPMPCRPKATEETNWPNHILADTTQRQLKTHLHRRVCVEEVPEFESTHMEAEPSPGFA